MKSLRILIIAGLALLGLTLAGSLKAASIPLAATPLSQSEMQDIRAGGQVTFLERTDHYVWYSTYRTYLTIPFAGTNPVFVDVPINAYMLNNTTDRVVWSHYIPNNHELWGRGSSTHITKYYDYHGGPLEGYSFSAPSVWVKYFALNGIGWPGYLN